MNRVDTQYADLLARDKTRPNDVERKAMFWIIASNEGLYCRANTFYDFTEHSKKPDGTGILSSGEKALMDLAFNLFNGYENSADVLDVFSQLDEDGFNAAVHAIRIRFGKV